jgi:lambda repressor-like predicted transcriptional regulator
MNYKENFNSADLSFFSPDELKNVREEIGNDIVVFCKNNDVDTFNSLLNFVGEPYIRFRQTHGVLWLAKKNEVKFLMFRQRSTDYVSMFMLKSQLNVFDNVIVAKQVTRQEALESPEKAYNYAKHTLHGRFEEGEELISQDAEASYRYAVDVLKGRFEEGEDLIGKDAMISYMYAKYVLKGPFKKGEDAIATDPKYTFYYVSEILDRPFPKGEDVLGADNENAFWYAEQILRGPFPKGEDTIAKDSASSVDYATLITKKPFHKGEKAIAENGQNSLIYVENVLKKRFPMGEAAIFKDPETKQEYLKFLKEHDPKGWTRINVASTLIAESQEELLLKRGDPIKISLYARNILKGPWPEAEDIIAKSAEASYIYAGNVLKGPFLKGEDAMSKDTRYAYGYAVNCLKGRFLKGERAIAADTNLAFSYFMEIMKKRWPEGELAIFRNEEFKRHYLKFLKEHDPRGWAKINVAAAAVLTPKPKEEVLKNGSSVRISLYARDVLKGPWPEAEDKISKGAQASYIYSRDVLKRTFPKGEDAIATDSSLSFLYFKNMIKKRWPKGEPAIFRSETFKDEYLDFVKKHDPKGWAKINIASEENRDVDSELYSYMRSPEVWNDDVSSVKPLLEAGADVNKMHNDKETVFQMAVAQELTNHIRLFLRYGADVNKKDNTAYKDTPIHVVIYNQNNDILKLLLDTNKVDFDVDDKKGDDYIVYAIKLKNPSAAVMLYKKGMTYLEGLKQLPRGYMTEFLDELKKREPVLWTKTKLAVTLFSETRSTFKEALESPWSAYDYAKNVVKGPWPEGEDLIARDYETSYMYAKNVLRGPFIKGEPGIAKHANYAVNYAKNGPFPRGEDKISESIIMSFAYSTEIIKKRFPKGEPSIFKNVELKRGYLNFLKKHDPKGWAQIKDV